MTKLRFYFILCKDEETLLRADETNIYNRITFGGIRLFGRNLIVFIGRGRKKRLLFVIFVREIE